MFTRALTHTISYHLIPKYGIAALVLLSEFSKVSKFEGLELHQTILAKLVSPWQHAEAQYMGEPLSQRNLLVKIIIGSFNPRQQLRESIRIIMAYESKKTHKMQPTKPNAVT